MARNVSDVKHTRRPPDTRPAGRTPSDHAQPVSRVKQDRWRGRRYREVVPTKNLDRLGPFAVLIRRARTERGLTQEQLADQSGVGRSTIIRWENGQITEPEPAQVRAAAEVLGIQLETAYRAIGWLPPEPTEIPPPPIRLRDDIERRLYERVHDILREEDVRRVILAFRVMREMDSATERDVAANQNAAAEFGQR